MGTDFVVLGTYPPTQCGLATFSAALLGDLPGPGDRVGVVRVLDEPSPDMAPPVVHDLVNGTAGAADDAAAVMNRFGVAIIQHEYGIYGGPDGADLLSLMQALTVPSIVVLHTVLAEPGPWQKMILGEVIAAASAVVTMTETGRQRVLDPARRRDLLGQCPPGGHRRRPAAGRGDQGPVHHRRGDPPEGPGPLR